MDVLPVRGFVILFVVHSMYILKNAASTVVRFPRLPRPPKYLQYQPPAPQTINILATILGIWGSGSRVWLRA